MSIDLLMIKLKHLLTDKLKYSIQINYETIHTKALPPIKTHTKGQVSLDNTNTKSIIIILMS